MIRTKLVDGCKKLVKNGTAEALGCHCCRLSKRSSPLASICPFQIFLYDFMLSTSVSFLCLCPSPPPFTFLMYFMVGVVKWALVCV